MEGGHVFLGDVHGVDEACLGFAREDGFVAGV